MKKVIKDVKVISCKSDDDYLFSIRVKEAVEEMQDEGLDVEIEFKPSEGRLNALVIGKRRRLDLKSLF